MQSLSYTVFGYRVIKVERECLSSFTALLFSSGISSTVLDCEIILSEKQYRRFLSLKSSDLDYTVSECLGLYGALSRSLRRYGTLAALFIGLLINLFLSSLVWDIRVEGQERLTYNEVVRGLDEAGFSVGKRIRSLDLNLIETTFLRDNPSVSFINVNYRGTVAYVKIAEKEGGSDPKEKIMYSNIIASSDGVIEEITVLSGIAAVKVGDVVKKGDLLISGVIPDDKGGGLCRAEGSVKASMGEDISVTVERKESKIASHKDRFLGVRLQFFDFKINILKKGGNSSSQCGIIEEIKAFFFGEGARLPFRITKVYETECIKSEIEYTDRELVSIALLRMRGRIATLISEGDLIKLKTDGAFTDTGYKMSTYAVYSRDIGEEREIYAEEG